MNKIKLSIIALSCVMALSACSSSSKGGSDNSEQIRQAETELTQRITEANKKAEAATKKAEDSLKKAEESVKKADESVKKADESVKKADESIKKAEVAIKVAQSNGNQTEEEKKETEAAIKAAEAERKAAEEAQKSAEEAQKSAEEAQKSAEEAKKATEERLKQLENLKADEKARIPLSDKVFGGISGEMKDTISGGTINLEKNELNSVLTADIRYLTIRDKDGRLKDVNILRTAGDMDPESFEEYEDPYNLRQYRQTILSNSNFQASAFGTYIDELTDQYFFAQGNPTALAQIPTAGKVEYDGGAVYKKDGDYGRITGMTATADFANKVIDINIKERGKFVPGMNFGGKITGNSFAGEVNGIKTQGGFFGKDAQEMTGLFTNEADQSRGAFGGIKQ